MPWMRSTRGSAASLLNALNAASLAGHTDWRLPSEDACNACFSTTVPESCTTCSGHELETILQRPCNVSPCIDPIFGPTAEYYYWSGTLDPNAPQTTWIVDFQNGAVALGGDLCEGVCQAYVRAVRTGP